MIPIVTRSEWGAKSGTGPPDPGPEELVVMHHSYRPALPATATIAQEISAWLSIERYHTETNGWGGIGYNFGVALSGRIYEGRGWKFRGAHAGPVNDNSIGICLLMDGSQDELTVEAIESVRELIRLGVQLGEIAPGYKITGHRDHMARVCPGDKVYPRLVEFYPDPEPRIDLVDNEPAILIPDLPMHVEPWLERPAFEVTAMYADDREPMGSWVGRVLERVLSDPEIMGRLGPFGRLVAWAVRKLIGILRSG